MTKDEYIKELELLTIFLARCYQDNFETFNLNYLKICDIRNPNRRDLTECEKSNFMKFSAVQGASREYVEKIANLKAGSPNVPMRVLAQEIIKNNAKV